MSVRNNSRINELMQHIDLLINLQNNGNKFSKELNDAVVKLHELVMIRPTSRTLKNHIALLTKSISAGCKFNKELNEAVVKLHEYLMDDSKYRPENTVTVNITPAVDGVRQFLYNEQEEE